MARASIKTKHDDLYMEALEKSISSLQNPLSKSFAQAAYLRYEFFRNYKNLNPMGSTASDGFVQIISNSLVTFGVDIKRLKFDVKSESSNVKIDILIVPRKGNSKAVALMLKTSLKERWKIDDRDALMIRHNAKNCWTEIADQHKLRSDIPPDIWSLTFKDSLECAPKKAIKMAKEKGAMAGGIQGDRLISIYDEEGMSRLLKEVA
jgi:hypothetical protein